MLLKTGFGILIKNGKKLRKFELDPNVEHSFPSEFTVQELESRDALNKIVLDKSDEQVAYERECKNAIDLRTSGKAKIKIAIPSLTDDELKALFGA